MSKSDEFFFKKEVSSKNSYWHVECSFDNSASKFPTKTSIFLFNAEYDKKLTLENHFSSNCSYRDLKSSFDNPTDLRRRKADILSLMAENGFKKSDNCFSSKLSSGHLGNSFDNLAEKKIRQKAWYLSVNVQKGRIFFSKHKLLNFFIDT